MRILITGERGAVGSYVKEAIAARYPDAEICHLGGAAVRFDLRNRDGVMDELCVQGWTEACDVLVLGAATRLDRNRSGPSLMDDIAMTSNVLSAVRPGGHIVYLSSATVYSGPGHDGLYEEDEQAHHLFELRPPTSSIGFAKLACERVVREHAASVKATHTIWRLHNVITPREQHEDPAHVQVRLFADMVLRQLPVIQMIGDGFDHRCWTWVGDVATAIAENLCAPKAFDRTFNLGSGVPINLRRLARTMLRVAKNRGYVPISYTPDIQWAPGNARPTSYPSSQLAELELGFQAPTMLGECMRLFLRGKMGAPPGATVAPGERIAVSVDVDRDTTMRIVGVNVGGRRYVPDKSVTDTDEFAAEIAAAISPPADDQVAWRKRIAGILGPAHGPPFLAGEFIACDACRAKPGAPELCAGCLANRANMGARR